MAEDQRWWWGGESVVENQSPLQTTSLLTYQHGKVQGGRDLQAAQTGIGAGQACGRVIPLRSTP